ncbi:MAG TPA: exosortase B [Candidatus Aquabacterium excrementipullorum]|nr:exosortase B [Candidatus Aquabacterium excrementipullorum]
MPTQVTHPSSISANPAEAAPNPGRVELALLALGLLVMYVPTYIILDKTIWNVVGQGHGPVILALTLWLGWQRWPAFMALRSRPRPLVGGLTFALGLLFYILGHSQDILMFDVGSQLLVLAGLFLLYKGWPGLKEMWFPLFFMLFLIPLPGIFVATLTGPLKSAVSYVAESIMYGVGYPVGRSGVTLIVGQYQLLVADACAGLNSIFALEAIGVFYLSIVQHANKWRNIALAVLILPISFVSNVARVIVLVLVTYYFGDEAGQGFVHDFAGILLFMVATVLTIGADSILGLFFREPAGARETAKPKEA